MPRAQSIHVGVNDPRDSFDPHLECVPPVLRHSEETAWRMAEIAGRAGYDSILVLRGAEATRQAVENALAAAAGALRGGDILFVSFSGHGKRVRDQDADERLGWDHAWCLHDGILLDDRLAEHWTGFEPGVRIVVVAEHCFGGGGVRGDDTASSAASRSPAPHGTAFRTPTGGAALRSPGGRGPAVRTTRDGGPALGPSRGGGQTMRTGRGEMWGRGAAEMGIARSEAARERTAEPCVTEAPHETHGIRASLLLLAASCEERQAKDGVYAEHLLAVWDGGAFRGSYCELHRRVTQRVMSESAPKPHIEMFGARDLDFQMELAFHRKR